MYTGERSLMFTMFMKYKTKAEKRGQQLVPLVSESEKIFPIPYAPWCWNIYQHLPHKSPSFVGKYYYTWNYMEHMGMSSLSAPAHGSEWKRHWRRCHRSAAPGGSFALPGRTRRRSGSGCSCPKPRFNGHDELDPIEDGGTDSIDFWPIFEA